LQRRHLRLLESDPRSDRGDIGPGGQGQLETSAMKEAVTSVCAFVLVLISLFCLDLTCLSCETQPGHGESCVRIGAADPLQFCQAKQRWNSTPAVKPRHKIFYGASESAPRAVFYEPRDREGQSQAEPFERYQGLEKARVLAIVQMHADLINWASLGKRLL
jgi:hypothetical protein